jgi:hypothetical protein
MTNSVRYERFDYSKYETRKVDWDKVQKDYNIAYGRIGIPHLEGNEEMVYHY